MGKRKQRDTIYSLGCTNYNIILCCSLSNPVECYNGSPRAYQATGCRFVGKNKVDGLAKICKKTGGRWKEELAEEVFGIAFVDLQLLKINYFYPISFLKSGIRSGNERYCGSWIKPWGC